MSEEEIIRIVSNLINEVFTGKLINMTKMAESYETNRQAIQGLLDLYNKEKYARGYWEQKVNDLEKEKNCVHKDKIKEVLEELQKKLEEADLGGFVDEVQDIKEDLLKE